MDSYVAENVKQAISEKLEEFIREVVSKEQDFFFNRTDEEVVQEFCEYANKW
jgi:hypothetical protein